MNADPARREALSVLTRYRVGNMLREEPTSGLARELVYGVLRHRRTVDAVIAPFIHQRLTTLQPALRVSLELGVWQFLFDAETPRPLVVASTVALAGASAKRRGFLNAVLRRIGDAMTPVAISDAVTRARDTIVTASNSGMKMAEPMLPDPNTDLPGYLAVQYSVTPWFAAHLVAARPHDVDSVLLACQRALPLTFRPNLTKGTPESIRAAVVAAGGVMGNDLGTVFEARFDGDIAKFRPLAEGLVSIQDFVAASVAPFVGPLAGERILDLCAGVGGKTVHLAELAPTAKVFAGDVSEVRLAKLRSNAKRLGLANVTTVSLGAAGKRLPEGPFDRVLVDAPCSNSGVLMKRIEARDRLTEETVDEVMTVQEEILRRGASLVKPHGTLVYSTCSILTEENRGIVDAFLLANENAWKLDEERMVWPHESGRDGGYMARLVRQA